MKSRTIGTASRIGDSSGAGVNRRTILSDVGVLSVCRRVGVPAWLEAGSPAADGVIIVQAQHLHVGHPESGTLGGGEHFRQGGCVGAGKDVFADERPRRAWRRISANAMHVRVAVLCKQRADLGEI